MKKITLLFALTAMVAFTACGDKNNNNSDSQEPNKEQQAEKKADQTTGATKQVNRESFSAEGQKAPEFKLPDIDGKVVSLSSLKGKYLVIDFWGTWCPFCVKGIPAMKEAYEKYSDKMEIVSIDCGDEEADWKKCVAENEMNWTNLFDPNGEIAKLYYVEGFPTKIVVDPDGKIKKVVTGETPEFYEYLDTLFQ